MGKHIVTVEVDTDRDIYGNTWGANFDGVPKHRDDEMRAYAESFGAGGGDQWDHPPHTQIISVEPVLPRPFTIHHSSGGRGEPAFGFWVAIKNDEGTPVNWGPYDMDESAAIKQAFADSGLSTEVPTPDARGDDPGYAVAVDVYDRDDGLYLFADQDAAEKFAAAVEAGGGSCAITDEPITSDPETVAKLIAAEDTEDDDEDSDIVDDATGQGRR